MENLMFKIPHIIVYDPSGNFEQTIKALILDNENDEKHEACLTFSAPWVQKTEEQLNQGYCQYGPMDFEFVYDLIDTKRICKAQQDRYILICPSSEGALYNEANQALMAITTTGPCFCSALFEYTSRYSYQEWNASGVIEVLLMIQAFFAEDSIEDQEIIHRDFSRFFRKFDDVHFKPAIYKGSFFGFMSDEMHERDCI
jgi:hypothetical protein